MTSRIDPENRALYSALKRIDDTRRFPFNRIGEWLLENQWVYPPNFDCLTRLTLAGERAMNGLAAQLLKAQAETPQGGEA